MLVLSRRVGERLLIGDDIVVTVIEVRSDGVRLGIEAPREVRVHRAEVLDAVRASNAAAVEADAGTEAALKRLVRPSPATAPASPATPAPAAAPAPASPATPAPAAAPEPSASAAPRAPSDVLDPPASPAPPAAAQATPPTAAEPAPARPARPTPRPPRASA